MSFPILHGLAGWGVSRASGKEFRTRGWVLYAMIAANLPDADFLPGLCVGKAGLFHHGPAHSFGAAALFALAAAAVVAVWKRRGALACFLLSFAAYSSHLVLDVLNGSYHGMPLFWPFSPVRFVSSLHFLSSEKIEPIENVGLSGFVAHVTSPQALRLLFYEARLAVLIVGSSFLIGELRKRRIRAELALEK